MLAIPAALSGITFGRHPQEGAWSSLILQTAMALAWFVLLVRLRAVRQNVLRSPRIITAVVAVIFVVATRLLFESMLLAIRAAGETHLLPAWLVLVVESPQFRTAPVVINIGATILVLWAIQTSVFHELSSLKRLSERDPLTDILNQNSFLGSLDRAIERCKSMEQPLSLVIIDIDHFKNYNDAYGHPAGNEVLSQLARILESHVRRGDLVARIGGEEFAVVLPGAGKDAACLVAERIRRAVEQHQFPRQRLTISLGLAQHPDDAGDRTGLIDLADRALYHAKISGRNRLYRWGTGIDQDSEALQRVTPALRLLFIGKDPSAREASMRAGESTAVTSADEALDMLRRESFDAIVAEAAVLDMEMREKITSARPDAIVVLIAEEYTPEDLNGVTDAVHRNSISELGTVLARHLYSRDTRHLGVMTNSTKLLFEALKSVVSAMDARDRYTVGHSRRVAELALAIADTLGLRPAERYALELASELHDIGKVTLPDGIMLKAGQLSEEDWTVIRSHSAKGGEIVAAVPELSYVAAIIRHHHERIDGKGYPDGLAGEAIPLPARILAVAEAFETMTSEHPRRRKFRQQPDAIAELRSVAGAEFDPMVIDALEQAIHLAASRQPLAA